MIPLGTALSAGRISFSRQSHVLSTGASRNYHALHRNSSPVLFAVAASRSKPPSTNPLHSHTQIQSRRPFSAVSALETTLTTTQHLFTELHNITGTPWYLTIPLIALSINLVTRFPLSIYARRVAVRRAKLTPLFQAWAIKHARDITFEPKFAVSQKARHAEIASRTKQTGKRIFKAWGVQRFKDFSPLGFFPVWLLGIESIRRLCGGPRGLIGTLVLGPDEATTTATGDAISASSDPADAASVAEITQDIVSSGADPSLATGGCLWFPDLMVADPLHILPLALSAVLVLHILPKSQAGIQRVFGLDRTSNQVVESQNPQRLTRAFLIMAVAIGPVTMDLPAALHLYWLSSATLTLIQTEVLAKLMPIPKQKVNPCSNNESIYLRPGRPEGQRS
ncbi:mitochondrial inner membrane protein OXA1L [Podospora aff. communis PSN243]|uniref:Mitochondrial inner membrane protein OXA1L n=1 Tax=Podospora aff. communis PSN243 TaxID=3040156 RepID=A0AAV9H3A1_9PEZI|nr:mitochondrial inner membrane protein OXA1L [Podospora aff. communis PSN243]